MPVEIHFKNEGSPGEELAIGEIAIDDFQESFESPPFDPSDPYRFIRNRQTVNDEGQLVSEWVSNV